MFRCRSRLSLACCPAIRLSLPVQIGAVVVGYDSELTYTKVAYALDVLSRVKDPSAADRDAESNRSVMFLSTNQDAIFPTAAQSLPGAGSCVAMVAATAGRTPVNIGKPQTIMLDLAVEKSVRTGGGGGGRTKRSEGEWTHGKLLCTGALT